jgi:predicted metal-binding protein
MHTEKCTRKNVHTENMHTGNMHTEKLHIEKMHMEKCAYGEYAYGKYASVFISDIITLLDKWDLSYFFKLIK